MNGTRKFKKRFNSQFSAWRGTEKCPSRLVKEAADNAKKEMLCRYPKRNIHSDTLVMHLRSGDIFQNIPFSCWIEKLWSTMLQILSGHNDVLLWRPR
jgi:hypothetical protein